MAGDWIKMRNDLADDPAVIDMAAALGIEEDTVVGKLHRLWSWADKQTRDGNAVGVSQSWVDKKLNVEGFAAAMIAVNWLAFEGRTMTFPNFGRHNGEPAKKRGEDAIRQRMSRDNRDKTVTGVTRKTIPSAATRHVLSRDAHTCVFCGVESSEAREKSKKAILSVDHLVPVAQGGDDEVSNLACCCRLCNNEKNNRTPDQWGLYPTFLQPGVTYSAGKMSQESSDKPVTREEKRREEPKAIPPQHTEVAIYVDAKAGALACKAMRAAGVPLNQLNAHNANLIAALEAGITSETLAATAAEAIAKGIETPFAWAVSVARRRLIESKTITTTGANHVGTQAPLIPRPSPGDRVRAIVRDHAARGAFDDEAGVDPMGQDD